MAKFATPFIFIAFLLFSTLTYAARPEPAFDEGVEAEHVENMLDENCEGVGEEECLMRRTLAAHIDYIYTQKQKP